MKQWSRDVLRKRQGKILHEIMDCECGVGGLELPFFYDYYFATERLNYPMREVDEDNRQEALKGLDSYMGTALTTEDPNLIYDGPEPGTGVAPLAKQLPMDNEQPWRCSEKVNLWFWVLKRVEKPSREWERFSKEVVEEAVGDWDSGELEALDRHKQPITEDFF